MQLPEKQDSKGDIQKKVGTDWTKQ